MRFSYRSALLLLPLGLCSCGGANLTKAPDPPIHVRVASCSRRTVIRQVTLPGDVRSYQEAQLFARVSGYLESVLVDRGDRVFKGQLLAKLGLPEAERELAQAQAAQNKGQAELRAAGMRVKKNQVEQSTATADYRRSLAQKQQLVAELGRARALEQQALAEKQLAEANRARLVGIAQEDPGLVAAQDMDVSRTALEVAQHKLTSAHSLVLSAGQSLEASNEAVASARTRIDASANQVRVAQAQEESSTFQGQADVQAAQKSADLLSYTEIRAPFAGTITARYLDAGALVQTSDRTAQQTTRPLLALADFDRVRVRVEPPQDVAALVVRGTPTTIHLDPDREFKARVARTSGVLDVAARTMVVEIDVSNPQHFLRPGMYVKVVLDLVKHPNVISIPAKALVVERDKRSVLVVRDQKVQRIEVKVGLENSEWVEITHGLKGGEEVVITSPGKLSDGAAVEVDR